MAASAAAVGRAVPTSMRTPLTSTPWSEADEVVLERQFGAVAEEQSAVDDGIVAHRQHTRSPTPQAAAISPVTSVSVAPSARRTVR